MTLPGVVPQLTGTPGRIRTPARWTVGADTETVLDELGVSADERAGLRDEGTI